MRRIQLIHDRYALIDDEDYEKVKGYNWQLNKKHGGKEYAVTRIQQKNKLRRNIKMHRIIMKAKQNQSIDHVNGNGLDNRKINLRFATPQQNRFNSNGNKNTSSIFKGVAWVKQQKKWLASIMINKKTINLKYYHNEIIAAWVYDQFAKILFKNYAKTNFPFKN